MAQWLHRSAGVLFVLGAVVQHNDPDPFLWIAVYLMAAGLAWCPKGSKLLRFGLVLGIGSLVWALALLFSLETWPGWEALTSSMKTVNIEIAREGLGLLLIGSYALLRARSGWRKTTS